MYWYTHVLIQCVLIKKKEEKGEKKSFVCLFKYLFKLFALNIKYIRYIIKHKILLKFWGFKFLNLQEVGILIQCNKAYILTLFEN